MSKGLAVITGASTEIGFELAKLAAQDGYNLIVVADEPLIDAAAQDFQLFGMSVRAIQADLSTTDGEPIAVLRANAGIGTGARSTIRTSRHGDIRSTPM